MKSERYPGGWLRKERMGITAARVLGNLRTFRKGDLVASAPYLSWAPWRIRDKRSAKPTNQ